MRICEVTGGLLQCHSCWGIQVHHRQASASTECCCSHCQRHTQLRPRCVTSAACPTALAGHSSASKVEQCINIGSPELLCIWCSDAHWLDISCQQHLWSTSYLHFQLFVLYHQRSMFGPQAFLVSGPMVWNLLTYQILCMIQHIHLSFKHDYLL